MSALNEQERKSRINEIREGIRLLIDSALNGDDDKLTERVRTLTDSCNQLGLKTEEVIRLVKEAAKELGVILNRPVKKRLVGLLAEAETIPPRYDNEEEPVHEPTISN